MSRAQARPQGSPILGTSRIGGWMETEEGNFCATEKIGHSVMQPENTTNETNKHQHSELERNLKPEKRHQMIKKGICGEDDDDTELRRGGRMLAAATRQGMTDLPLFHPECGGSRPTGFPGSPHPNIGKNVFHCDPKSLSSDVR